MANKVKSNNDILSDIEKTLKDLQKLAEDTNKLYQESYSKHSPKKKA